MKDHMMLDVGAELIIPAPHYLHGRRQKSRVGTPLVVTASRRRRDTREDGRDSYLAPDRFPREPQWRPRHASKMPSD